MKHIYLAGPIAGCSDSEANDWRQHSKQRLEAAGFKVLDPMTRDFRGHEMTKEISKIIVEGDKKDIDDADIVLVCFEKESVGTSMEIIYAWERERYVYIVNLKTDKRTSPWMVYHSEGVYFSLDNAIDRIIEVHA